MTNRELEQRIRTAVEHAVPDRLDSILTDADRCLKQTGGQEKGDIIYMSESKTKKSRMKSTLVSIAAVAAAFVLCICGYGMIGKTKSAVPQVDSVIMLDVNPSLTLSVDADEKVLSAEALNDDAKEILGSMELEGTSLEVAVNAIIGSMLQKGYLGDMQNAVLVSVENSDAARGEELQKKVSRTIEAAMENDSVEAAVLTQNVSAGDAELAGLAEKYDISMGKAALIQEVTAQSPELTFEELVPMTINEIALIASSRHVEAKTVTQTGTASNKAYISREEALNRACVHAGVAAADVTRMEIEFDSEGGIMVYEVEFLVDDMEYEYDIDARTGEVIKFKTEDRSSVVSKTQPEPSAAASYIGEAAAKAAALSHAGVAESDTKYIHGYLDYDNGRPVHYDVEFVAGNVEYDYEIDLYTGEILESKTENCDSYDGHHDSRHESHSHHGNSSQIISDGSAYIGEQAALAAVLDHAGISESEVKKQKIKLDEDNGRMIYEVDLETGRKEYEYEIDALTGKILSAEIDVND